MKPPTGYYRQLMPSHLSEVRIAIASQPMTGVTRIDPAPVLEALRDSDDDHAPYYINGLEDGTFIAVVENRSWGVDKHWAPGELFLKS